MSAATVEKAWLADVAERIHDLCDRLEKVEADLDRRERAAKAART